METISYPCKIDHSLQPAMIRRSQGAEARPLLVGLHTWSSDCTIACEKYCDVCAVMNWNLIYPNFRGPNWDVNACGSDFVISDLEDAVAYMKESGQVDPARIYLCGGSGGGHCALLMAGRRPDLWTAVSAWCPISDIAAWHEQCLNTPNKNYSENIEVSCGGNPATSPVAAREALLRSPVTWLKNAKGVILDISTGIHDGHRGSVPVSQAIRAFNEVALPKDRLVDEEIDFIVKTETIPAHLKAEATDDPAFGAYAIHFRRQSGNARLTLFEGAHDQLLMTACQWLERQLPGKPADWAPGPALPDVGDKARLAR